MAPLLEDGGLVEVARRRVYWPGDIVVIRGVDRSLARAPAGRRLSEGLAAAVADPGRRRSKSGYVGSSHRDRRQGHGWERRRAPVERPLRTRLWALGRFLRFVGLA